MAESGGEVLRYIGDASLAIFPFERYADERAAYQAALDVILNAVAGESKSTPPAPPAVTR